MLHHIIRYNAAFIKKLSTARAGETKLGEVLQTLPEDADPETALASHPAGYVLLGIPEDIGVRANFGRPGTASCWSYFLKAFLNAQFNSFFNPSSLLLLGHVDTEDLSLLAEQSNDVEKLRELVAELDKRVSSLIEAIVKAGKIPLIIGGGHNNAYPILKGSALAWHASGRSEKASINCINLDAHADLRPLEGRHSGNGFSYALEENYLEKYFVLGLHEAYITRHIEEQFAQKPAQLAYTSFEDLAVREKISFKEALQKAVDFTQGYCGIELDMDCIRHLPSSALSSTGFTAEEARRFIHYVSLHAQPAYLHITEAAPALARSEDANATAKLIAMLVLDFLKNVQTGKE